MQITDFMRREDGWSETEMLDILCDIAGVTAAHVPGVARVGEPVLPVVTADGVRIDNTAPGCGVVVRRWGEDLWLHLWLTLEAGYDVDEVGSEVSARVQTALQNLLNLRATGIEIEMQVPLQAEGPQGKARPPKTEDNKPWDKQGQGTSRPVS